MGKAIVVSIDNKLFGVFSNKTNAFKAIQAIVLERLEIPVESLVVLNKKEDGTIPASYNNIVLMIKHRDGIIKLYQQSAIDSATEDSPAPSFIQVRQMDMNYGIDGKLYKSSEEESE
jgi:hypothetical protein